MTEPQSTTQRSKAGVPISKGVGVPVTYDLTPAHTALISIDFQLAFGDGSWEHVPHAGAAVERFSGLATHWRAAGGVVIHVHTTFYDGEQVPAGREELTEGRLGASFYPKLVEDGDILVRKLGFSAVSGSDLLDVLKSRGFDTAIVGGLTTWPASRSRSCPMPQLRSRSARTQPNSHMSSQSPEWAISWDR
jgi:isochorismate hydrolase